MTDRAVSVDLDSGIDRIALHCTTPALADQIVRHVRPGFVPTAQAPADIEVTVEVMSAPPPLPSGPGTPVNLLNASYSFPAESGMAWESGESRTAHNHANGAVVVSTRDYRAIKISAVSMETAFRTTYRVLRELQIARLAARGFVRLHAACCESAGVRVAISGDKGAGKSTMLMTLVLAAGFDFVGSDRAMIGCSGGDVTVCGLTESVNLGVGTLQRFTELRRFLPENLRDLPSERLWGREEKIAIAATDVVSDTRLGRPGPQRLNCVLFPRISPHGALRIRRLDEYETTNCLATNLQPGEMQHGYLTAPAVRTKPLVASGVAGLSVDYGSSLGSDELGALRSTIMQAVSPG
jgi:hypothetical protein